MKNTDDLLIELIKISQDLPTVCKGLEMHTYYTDKVTLIDALITIVIALSESNKTLLSELIKCQMNRPSQYIMKGNIT